MTDNRMPAPLLPTRQAARPLCPVCGMTSYSKGGIHPQCAQQQADGRRMDRIKAVKRQAEAKAKPRNPLALNPWHKRCPRCRAEMHIRKAKCQCGHQFATMRAR